MPLPAPVMRMTFPDSVGDMEMVDGGRWTVDGGFGECDESIKLAVQFGAGIG
jgi:hypothetical protein